MDTVIKRNATRRLIIAILSFVVGFLFIETVCYGFEQIDSNGVKPNFLWVVGFAALMVIWNEVLIIRQKDEGGFVCSKARMVEIRFWEAVLMALSILCGISMNIALTFFFLIACTIYMVMCTTGHLFREETSVFLPADIINGVFRIPFAAFNSRIAALRNFLRVNAEYKSEQVNASEAKKSRTGIAVGIALIVVAVPVLAIVLSSLSSADANFENIMNSISESIGKFFEYIFDGKLAEIIIKMIFAYPCGLYIHSLFEGSINRNASFERRKEKEWSVGIKKLQVVPFGIIMGIFAVFTLVYILFFISQATNLFSAFAGVLPQEYTASRYARNGFFELCRVMVINILMLGVLSVFSRKDLYESAIMKITGVSFMVESFIFSLISASKLLLYINRFGFTVLRYQSLWATAVLGAASLLIAVNIITHKKTAKIWLWFTALSYIAVNIFVAAVYFF